MCVMLGFCVIERIFEVLRYDLYYIIADNYSQSTYDWSGIKTETVCMFLCHVVSLPAALGSKSEETKKWGDLKPEQKAAAGTFTLTMILVIVGAIVCLAAAVFLWAAANPYV